MALPPEIRSAYLRMAAALRNGKRVRFVQPVTEPFVAVTMTEVPGSATPNNSSKFRAVVEVDGIEFAAISRRGASCALARKLVAAGVPDQPMQVHDANGRLLFQWPSLHQAAGLTYAESEKTSLRSGKYVNLSDRLANVPPPAPKLPRRRLPPELMLDDD